MPVVLMPVYDGEFISKWIAAIALWLLLVVSRSYASERLVTPMYNSDWRFQGSPFRCDLSLPNEQLGDIRFRREAGIPLTFIIHPFIAVNDGDKANIYWRNAPWRNIQSGPVYRSDAAVQNTLRLDAISSRNLFLALDGGNWGTIVLSGRRYTVPSIRWGKAAYAFRRCLSALAPMSYEQARDQVLFYHPGQRALDVEQRHQLAKLARYVTLDPLVTEVWVDAYTDNTGLHFANLQLSKERAADVRSALIEAGMPHSLIHTRAHGDRYPSASNRTAKGRALNRRVMLRVVRKEKKANQ